MALTKAELAEVLFDKYGISKQDAKVLVEDFFEEIRVALENLNCEPKISALAVILKRVKKFQFRRVAWLLLNPGKNLKAV